MQQDSSLSVWQRRGTGLTYTALTWHKLVPPPSRSSSAAAPSVISAAAAVWRPQQDNRSDTAAASGKENSGMAAGSGGMILRRQFGSRGDEDIGSSMQSMLQQATGGSINSGRDAAAAYVADLNRCLLITCAPNYRRDLTFKP